MKLITKEIEKKLLAHPLYSTDGQETKEVIVKFFAPSGSATWYVVEGNQLENNDWEFFGKIEMNGESEWGYFTLSQLREVRLPFGLKIERDMYFEGTIKL